METMDYEKILADVLADIDAGALEKAKAPLKQLARYRRTFSPSVQATILGVIGLWHKAQGDYARALTFARKGIRLLENAKLTEEPLESLATLAGGLHRELGQPEEARRYFTAVLAIRKSTLGEEHPDLIVPLCNMGGLMLDTREYEASIRFYRQALSIAETHLGPEHASTAAIQCNLGEVYRVMGEFEQALPLFSTAHDTLVRAEGSQSRSLISVLNNLSVLYIELNRHRESIPCLEQAIALLADQQTHPLLGNLYHNLACAYRDLGQTDQAEPLFQKALIIRLNRLGHEHPLVAVTLNNLGWMYLCSGQPDRAESALNRAHDILLAHYGADHPELCPVLNNLGQLAMRSADYEKAQRLYQQCIDITMACPDIHQANLAVYWHNLSEVWEHAGLEPAPAPSPVAGISRS
jgi:tetratricopeptide (TPR) repeat protein